MTVAAAACMLVAGAASASADTPQGRVCSSGTSGSVCTQVTLTTGNARYGYAAADTTNAPTHTICLLGVAEYAAISPTATATDVADNNAETCVTDAYFSMRTASVSVSCGDTTLYLWTAVQYTVDGGAAERFQSDPVKVC